MNTKSKNSAADATFIELDDDALSAISGGAVKAHEYNQVRSVLIGRGSMTAAKSHPIHANRGSVPDHQMSSLLSHARDENPHQPGSQAHYDWHKGVSNAANSVGFTEKGKAKW